MSRKMCFVRGLLCFIFGILPVLAIPWNVVNELDQYVRTQDSIYSYSVIDNQTDHPANLSVSIVSLNVTTHRWMTERFSDRHVQIVHIMIFIPKTPRFFNTGFVYIDAGSLPSGPPDPGNEFATIVAILAHELGLPTAFMRMIPNQPTTFYDDPELKPRYEDDLIAHTWKKFIDNSSDPTVIAQFPMTKNAYWAVRAMMTELNRIDPRYNITNYIPAGGSKRGWITWLLGSVDPAVSAMAPIVLSCLNLIKNFHHYYRALGNWSWVLSEYWEHEIMGNLDHPNGLHLERLIDPLSYNERLTMPKVVVNAVGDEFFMPDDHHYFFSELTPPKWIQMIPNAEHGIAPWYGKVYRTLRSLVLATCTGTTLPTMHWIRNETSTGGSITLWTDQVPINVTAWGGENNHRNRRDFRYVVLKEPGICCEDEHVTPNFIRWYEKPAEQLGMNEYHVTYDKTMDINGTWFGFFIEVEFEGPEGLEFSVTSEVNIIPDMFLYPQCSGFDQCQGILV